MNYVVLDLEMCRVPKQYRNKKYKYANEIIQVTNTAKLIKVLELDQNFVICRYEFDEKETFGFSLSDFFAGLNLECIA